MKRNKLPATIFVQKSKHVRPALGWTYISWLDSSFEELVNIYQSKVSMTVFRLGSLIRGIKAPSLKTYWRVVAHNQAVAAITKCTLARWSVQFHPSRHQSTQSSCGRHHVCFGRSGTEWFTQPEYKETPFTCQITVKGNSLRICQLNVMDWKGNIFRRKASLIVSVKILALVYIMGLPLDP